MQRESHTDSFAKGWSPTGRVWWIAMANNPFRSGRMGHSPLCVVWVDWSSSWSSGGELPFCNCVFADWVGICKGGGTTTTCKSDNSHTCAGHWYDGLQWAGCVGTCRDGTKDNFATRRMTAPYLSSEHTVTVKTTCGSGDIHHPPPHLSMSVQCS